LVMILSQYQVMPIETCFVRSCLVLLGLVWYC
jgi:hypothetical protein